LGGSFSATQSTVLLHLDELPEGCCKLRVDKKILLQSSSGKWIGKTTDSYIARVTIVPSTLKEIGETEIASIGSAWRFLAQRVRKLRVTERTCSRCDGTRASSGKTAVLAAAGSFWM
jgi:hypothetical protein